MQKPKIIQSIISGFNTTANNIFLILLPLLLDLFLWFGPHFSLNHFFITTWEKFLNGIVNQTSEVQSLINSNSENLLMFFRSFNLSATLRTFPVGIPSLISNLSTEKNPIGTPLLIEFGEFSKIIVILITFSFIGIILGVFYYNFILSKISKETDNQKIVSLIRSTTQIFLFPIFLVLLMLVLLIPFSIVISILTIINPMIGQIGLFLSFSALVWILIPLFFTPHSIILLKQNLITSMMTSINVVRSSSSTSILFLLTLLILGQGTNLIWKVPPEDSWMLLIGILGHAFISTSLIAASFHYFIHAFKYAQSLVTKSQAT